MIRLPIADLARIIHAEPSAAPAGTIVGISTDSRTIKPGQCFFAIKGENFDGHDFLHRAFEKGAACAVTSGDVTSPNLLLLRVPGTVKALGQLAAWYRLAQNFRVITITGSVGKTTTREMLHHVLKNCFRTHQALGSFNNEIGLPLTILSAPADSQILILELGSNQPGEIARLTQIAAPDFAIVTNIHLSHLEGFGTIDEIIKEKISIHSGLKHAGTFLINGDIPALAEYCRRNNFKFTTFGKSPHCDIRAENIRLGRFSGSFNIADVQVAVPLPGPGNIENALAAWALASQFGISPANFANVLATFSPLKMRTEIIRIGPLAVLSDCYNANPASMKNALDCLTNLAAGQNTRTVFICGEMLELGPQTQKLHAELGKNIAAAGIKLLLTTGQLTQITARTAKDASHNKLQAASFPDTASLCDNLYKFIQPDDIILVKGSRGCKLESALEKLRELFVR